MKQQHVVVTIEQRVTGGPKVNVYGPWTWKKADCERRRLLADFAYRKPYESARGHFGAYVAEPKDEVVEP